jgi:hypothetical protein
MKHVTKATPFQKNSLKSPKPLLARRKKCMVSLSGADRPYLINEITLLDELISIHSELAAGEESMRCLKIRLDSAEDRMGDLDWAKRRFYRTDQ